MSVFVAIVENGRPEMIVETARQLICALDRNGCVQTLVGYKNMKHIMLPVSQRLRAKQIEAGAKDEPCPDSIESYARFIANSCPPDLPSRWRSYWFLYGSLLMKVEDIAEHDPAYQQSVWAIWNHLSECQDIIENVLRDNILWTEDEKDIGLRNRRQRTPSIYL